MYNIAKNLLISIKALKNLDSDLDEHYKNILLALNSDLPLTQEHYNVIIYEITKKLSHYQQSFDEYYIQQCIKILLSLPFEIYQLQLQCSISILGSLVELITQMNQSDIGEIFTLFQKITQNNKALEISYPKLFIKTLSLLLKFNRGNVQEKGLLLINHLLTFIFSQTPFDNQDINFNISTLQIDCDNTTVQYKVNEELKNFCLLNSHLPTPKLNQCYTNWIFEILKMKNVEKYLWISTQIELLNIYFRYQDPKCKDNINIILQINNYRIQHFIIEIEENLYFELGRLKKLQNEIESSNASAIIRKLRWLIIIILDYWQNQVDQNVHYKQLCDDIAKSLLMSIQYQWNHFNLTTSQRQSNQNIELSIQNTYNGLNLELLPIVNSDKIVLTELITLLNNLQKYEQVGQFCFDKFNKLLDKLIQSIINDSGRIIKLQINHILQIASLLFMLNEIKSIKLNNHDFLLLIKKCYLLIFNQNTPYNLIFQYQLVSFVNNQFNFENDDFILVTYLDYLICLNSQEIGLLQDKTIQIIKQYNINDYIASIIYRNISKIQESNLEVDQGNALSTILNIYIQFDGFNQGLDTLNQILRVIYQIFDKYYLKSDILFTQKYLQFLISFFKSWINPILNNDLVTILRWIILSIPQFFHHSSLHLYSLQCFYYSIPILSRQELKESKPDQKFGMNDDVNVVVIDTIGTIFYEQLKSFYFILQQENQIDKIYIWMILNNLFIHQSCQGFFSLSSFQTFLKDYLKLEKEETQNAIKLYQQQLELIIQYINKNEINPNIKDLIKQIKPYVQSIKQIGSKNLQPLINDLFIKIYNFDK